MEILLRIPVLVGTVTHLPALLSAVLLGTVLHLAVPHLLVQDLLEETAELGVGGVLVVLQEIDSVELEIPVLHLIKLVTVKLGMLVVHGMLETATTTQMYVTQTMQLLVQMETVMQETVPKTETVQVETVQVETVMQELVKVVILQPIVALDGVVLHLLAQLLQTVTVKLVFQHT